MAHARVAQEAGRARGRCRSRHAADRARRAARDPERDGGADRAHRHVAVHPREEGLLRRAVRRATAASSPAPTCRCSATSSGRSPSTTRSTPCGRATSTGTTTATPRAAPSRIRPTRCSWRRCSPRQARPRSRSPGRTSTTSAACAPGSLSPDCTEIYQEGIIVPPVRVAREGVINEELLRLFYRNSRFPEMVKGDTRASMAAIRLGERRLAELFERFGRAKMRAAFERADRRDRAGAARASCAPWCRTATTASPIAIDSDGHGNGPIKLRYRLERDARAHQSSTPARATTRCRGRSTSS